MSHQSKTENKRKVGRPSKATPERIEAILADIASGLTREQACAYNGVSITRFREWEKKPEFPQLRACAEAARIKALQAKIDKCGAYSGDWKRFSFYLERTFPQQFGDPNKVQIFAQQNNCQIPDAELKQIREREQRLALEIDSVLAVREETNGNGAGRNGEEH
jgi:hypothetical protein